MKQSIFTIRTLYHIILGLSIGYLFFLICRINTNNFPLKKEYWNNYLCPLIDFIPAAFICFMWDKWQFEKFGAIPDKVKMYITGFAGVLGGFLAMFWGNWIVAIISILVSIVLVVKHYKN